MEESYSKKLLQPSITPDSKIKQLHDLMKDYVLNQDKNRLQCVLPCIQQHQLNIHNKQKQIQKLRALKPSQKQLTIHYQNRKQLAQEISELAKQVQAVKKSAKSIRLKRIQAQQQLSKNQNLLKQLIKQCEKSQIFQGKSGRQSTLPRISGFNYELHHNKIRRMNSNPVNLSSSRSSQRPKDNEHQKQNFYNSINFQRIKQIQRILDQGTYAVSQLKFQKILRGNPKQSIVKKVFKNFEINQYFNEFIHNKFVHKYLQNLIKQ